MRTIYGPIGGTLSDRDGYKKDVELLEAAYNGRVRTHTRLARQAKLVRCFFVLTALS